MFPTNQLGTSVKNDICMCIKNTNETTYKQWMNTSVACW